MQIQDAADNAERLWCMSEVDIFCDLNEQEERTKEVLGATVAPRRPWVALVPPGGDLGPWDDRTAPDRLAL